MKPQAFKPFNSSSTATSLILVRKLQQQGRPRWVSVFFLCFCLFFFSLALSLSLSFSLFRSPLFSFSVSFSSLAMFCSSLWSTTSVFEVGINKTHRSYVQLYRKNHDVPLTSSNWNTASFLLSLPSVTECYAVRWQVPLAVDHPTGGAFQKAPSKLERETTWSITAMVESSHVLSHVLTVLPCFT